MIRGAKAHQTGCINSHWLIVMPTMRLGAADRDYAVVCAVPGRPPGHHLHLRPPDLRHARARRRRDRLGNARFGGQEAMIVFDDVFVPTSHVFMDGEFEFAAMLVERFTATTAAATSARPASAT